MWTIWKKFCGHQQRRMTSHYSVHDDNWPTFNTAYLLSTQILCTFFLVHPENYWTREDLIHMLSILRAVYREIPLSRKTPEPGTVLKITSKWNFTKLVKILKITVNEISQSTVNFRKRKRLIYWSLTFTSHTHTHNHSQLQVHTTHRPVCLSTMCIHISSINLIVLIHYQISNTLCLVDLKKMLTCNPLNNSVFLHLHLFPYHSSHDIWNTEFQLLSEGVAISTTFSGVCWESM